jgi:hypothetical protein
MRRHACADHQQAERRDGTGPGSADFRKHVESLGMEPAGGTPQELGAWVRSELARWTKAVRDAGIQTQAT